MRKILCRKAEHGSLLCHDQVYLSRITRKSDVKINDIENGFLKCCQYEYSRTTFEFVSLLREKGVANNNFQWKPRRTCVSDLINTQLYEGEDRSVEDIRCAFSTLSIFANDFTLLRGNITERELLGEVPIRSEFGNNEIPFRPLYFKPLNGIVCSACASRRGFQSEVVMHPPRHGSLKLIH